MTLSTAQRRAVTLSTLAEPACCPIPGDRSFDPLAEIRGGFKSQFVPRAGGGAHPAVTDHLTHFVARKDAGFPGEFREDFRAGSGGERGSRWNRDDARCAFDRQRDIR